MSCRVYRLGADSAVKSAKNYPDFHWNSQSYCRLVYGETIRCYCLSSQLRPPCNVQSAAPWA